MNLFGEFCSAFRGRRDAPFLEVADGSARGAVLSFAELDAQAAGLAGVLRHTLDLAPGDVVLVAVQKSVHAIALYLACLRAGVVYLPANPAFTARELALLIDDARPRAIIADPATARSLAPAGTTTAAGATTATGTATAAGTTTAADTRAATGTTPCGGGSAPRRPAASPVFTLDEAGAGSLADAARAAPAFRAAVPRENAHPAALLYTSGTTGTPKGVLLSHGNLLSNVAALRETWNFDGGDVLVHALPMFHVHGLFVALHLALLTGARVRLLNRFDAGAVCALLPDATVYMGVPTHYARLLQQATFDRAACAGLRVAISGSAPLPKPLFEAVRARTGLAILERYGMTETGMLTSNPLHGERVPGTVGFALPGVSLRIERAPGVVADPGETGAVLVRGPGVFAGYLNRPEVNAGAFTDDGCFRTGDLGCLDAEGRLTLRGRARDLIISGGFNLYPAEIEACLDALPGVAESAVVGVPDDDLGEIAVAAVVPADPARPPDAQALLGALAGQLARYKHPRRIVLRGALPRNTMGKVLRPVLREELGGRTDG